ncbi:MAG: helicase-related protein [Pseudomonadota bacterium]
MALETAERGRHITAVLGPTNTGKTHLAIERMLDHDTGLIGLPLRLLAREVYDKIANRVGPEKVALITGEEKIKPEGARYWVSTVEAMPRDLSVDFLAIDEVQLAADFERGHTFTERLLNARGQIETLLLGAGTMQDVIGDLIPDANFVSRQRMSKLTYAGQKKITRLPERSAIVAFSASDVYAIAELIRRQRGGAAVVLGALSPRTRNAQVALYQSGDVDYLVATDAVGMGLNLDVDHVAFSAVRKFDGQNFRNLTPAELGQIGGRAGRHTNDGTFGVTGDVEPFDNDLVERLENHIFDPVKTLQWRSTDLDFGSLDALRDSLRHAPTRPGLMRARDADDVIALETLARDPGIAGRATGKDRVTLLWEACQIPDYQKISSQNHSEIIAQIYKDLTDADGLISEDWFARQVSFSDRTDGDIDTLANRIAHIRTWTFVSNRPGWLKDPDHWLARTREIENKLSDALHECLTQRFVDQRTSALMKRMRVQQELTADIGEDGTIQVEGHFVGRLNGFRFQPDSRSEDVHGKASRHAAAQVLTKELSMRVRRVAAAKNDALKITPSARVTWRDEEIARLIATDDPLRPRVELLADEHLQAADRDKVQSRADAFVHGAIAERLKPLVELSKADDISGLARGISFQLVENFGVLKREAVGEQIKSLDQTARSQLRKYGVRFGAFNIFIPLLLKPAAADLLRVLYILKHGERDGLSLDVPPEPPKPGLTSFPAVANVPPTYYAVSGFHLCGPRAVRIDMLERLADQIRPLVAAKANKSAETAAALPAGATGDGGFIVTADMMSILGCSPEELGDVLRSLGFRSEKRPKPAEPKAEADPVPASDAAETTAPSPAKAAEAEVETAIETAGPAAEAPPATEAVSEDAATPATADEASSAPAPVADAATAPATAPEQSAEPATPVAQTDEANQAAEPAVAEASPDGETAEAVSEPEMIEIWRPRRRGQDHRGERGNRRRRGGTRTNEAGAPHQRGDGARDGADNKSGGGGPGPRRKPAKADGGKRHGGPGGQGGKDRGENRGPNDRAARGRGGPPRGKRKEGPRVISAKPKSSGGEADSPFAALLALKEAADKPAGDKP